MTAQRSLHPDQANTRATKRSHPRKAHRRACDLMLWFSLHTADSLDALVLGVSDHETTRLRHTTLFAQLDLLLTPFGCQAAVEGPAPQQNHSDLCESRLAMWNKASLTCFSFYRCSVSLRLQQMSKPTSSSPFQTCFPRPRCLPGVQLSCQHTVLDDAPSLLLSHTLPHTCEEGQLCWPPVIPLLLFSGASHVCAVRLSTAGCRAGERIRHVAPHVPAVPTLIKEDMIPTLLLPAKDTRFAFVFRGMSLGGVRRPDWSMGR